MADPVPHLDAISARYARQLHVNPIAGTASAGFNTTAAPFDDVRVRQAVSLGLDRRKAVSVFGGPLAAQPTCQFIPPGLPGYRPYCPYTVDPGPAGQWIGPDLARARKLIDQAHAEGARVVVWGHSGDQALGSYFVGQLDRLGLRASLHLATDTDFNDNVNDSRRHVQVTVSEWIVDYPSPSDIFDLFLRCSTFTLDDPADTRSGAFFCHPNIDRQMDEADRLQISDPARAARVWATVDREVTDLAPSVEFVSLRWADFTSARVGDYQYSSRSGVLLDQLWVH
jgi:peptide/nickel transport system substrate-binding protein